MASAWNPRRWHPALQWCGWIIALLALVALLVPVRDTMQQSHVALLLLLVVLGASATVGFGAGMTQVRITAQNGMTLTDTLPEVKELLEAAGLAQFQ